MRMIVTPMAAPLHDAGGWHAAGTRKRDVGRGMIIVLACAAACWWLRPKKCHESETDLGGLVPDWPAAVAARDCYSGPWSRRTTSTILLLANTGDPVTAYQDSIAMSRPPCRVARARAAGTARLTRRRQGQGGQMPSSVRCWPAARATGRVNRFRRR